MKTKLLKILSFLSCGLLAMGFSSCIYAPQNSNSASSSSEFSSSESSSSEENPSKTDKIVYRIDNDEYATVVNYTGNEEEITIDSTYQGKPVISIKERAFDYCHNLTNITIPDSILSIGAEAFYNCSNLTKITIPDSVISIGENAFFGCDKLEEMMLPFVGSTKYGTDDSSFGYIFGKIPSSLKSVIVTGNAIGTSAFSNCSNLTSVTLSGSVTSINNLAFEGCSGITSITIPNSVTSINDSAFAGCSGITSITIPDSVAFIGECAFADCDSLTSITLPDSVDFLGYEAFWHCDNLTNITIGDIAYIGPEAFWDCNNLKNVYYTGDAETWEDLSFDNYFSHPLHHAENLYINDTLVTGWELPKTNTGAEINQPNTPNYDGLQECIENNIKYMGDENNPYLYLVGVIDQTITTASIHSGCQFIEAEAFWDCTNLTEITIPNSVTSIGDHAFSCCEYLTSVIIGNSVMTIGEGAFASCYKLTNITIPDTVTSIADGAFYGCSSLTSITVPNSVTSIGYGTFLHCFGLTEMTLPFVGGTKNSSKTSYFGYIFGKSIRDYSPLIPSSLKSITITGGEIGNYAFFNCIDGETSITLPDGITSIGNYAFYGCGATNITIPNTVTSIGNYAFYGCGATNITIPNTVTSIGNYAFYGCPASMTALNSLTSIGDYAQCYSNVIPDTLTAIGYNSVYADKNLTCPAFAIPYISKTNLETLVITSGDAIDCGAFYHCSLTSITIPDTVTTIDYHGFSNCSIKNIYYTGSIEDWCNISFKDICSNPMINNNYGEYNLYIDNTLLEGDLVIPDTVTEIKAYTFLLCNKITSVTIPNSVTSIGNSAFRLCYGITNVTIGNSVTSIGNWAFYACWNLTSITIPNSVTTIGDCAFSECSSLAEINFTGTMAQWNAIHKDSNWKNSIPATKVICTDGEVTL